MILQNMNENYCGKYILSKGVDWEKKKHWAAAIQCRPH